MTQDTLLADPEVQHRDRIVIRFAGDSGDGMQLAGTRFTDASALFGNDLATFPSFPAEIRAPAGTVAGVSSFQIHIADFDILTPGDAPDVLVAMNPAALMANLADVEEAGLLILNSDAFNERNFAKCGYDVDPREDGTLDQYNVLSVPMEELTKLAVVDSGVRGRATLRSKNFFALGLITWMFGRTLDPITDWIDKKFGADQPVGKANTMALKAGYNYGITTDAVHYKYDVPPAKMPAGTYTNITGNKALAWGLIAAAQLAKLPLFFGSYPITPASGVLEELARQKHFGVKTFQAEDEIAAAGISVGASFAGHLAATGTSGPGVALKSETISLALMMELPLVIVNVQRAGPSTGIPTKTEQADLMSAIYGRHGESPLPVIAAASPGDAFSTAIEACRIALKYMTPVILLSDGFVANSSEPWMLPDVASLPEMPVSFATEPNGEDGEFLPYKRNEFLARPWAIPGTPGLEHRLGGLEKQVETGNVNYVPENHAAMTELRERKIAGIAKDIPPVTVEGPENGDVLVLGWGGTYGSIRAGVLRAQQAGYNSVASAHLRHLFPFPANLGSVLRSYKHVIVPELNRGQLSKLLQAEYLIPIESYPKIMGVPFKATEIQARIVATIEGDRT